MKVCVFCFSIFTVAIETCLYLEDGAGVADGNKSHLNTSTSIDINHTLGSAQLRELLNCNIMNSPIIKRSTLTPFFSGLIYSPFIKNF